MIVVNLYGGPGSGKSTVATGVFSNLKLAGFNVEYVSEFAKDLTWEKRHNTLNNQLYIFAKQQHKLWRVKDDVDVIVTDSPLLFSLVYGNPSKRFQDLVIETYFQFNNLNIFINRKKTYNPSGRSQTEQEAKELDLKIEKIVSDVSRFDFYTDGTKEGIDTIAEFIEIFY